MKNLYILIVIATFFSCRQKGREAIGIDGELKQWHKVTLTIPGPFTSEWAKENPFLNYKLEVVFSNGEKSYEVPGYYAADGNAGETSGDEGNVWKVHFRPDEVGEWSYKVSFRRGANIAIRERKILGEPLDLDGFEGVIKITESDKTGDDFRARGRIVNGGKGYFKFQKPNTIWIKNGADSPENFLAYADFDQTLRFSLKTGFREGEANPKSSLHHFKPHVADWNEGDPTWQNGKGKGVIGALNYLQSVGVNSVYMLTMNILGDGNDVWPYSDYNERYRFDCSKLDQWEVVFDYMEKLGIMSHFVLQETENEVLLDAGNTDVQRRLYLRELVARFGHHLAVSWNLGEENGPADWTPIGQTNAQRKAMAAYLKSINPYPGIVVLHTHANNSKQDEILGSLLGFTYLDGVSMQIGNPNMVHSRIEKWAIESERANKRWLVNLDEIGPHWKGVLPDSYDEGHDTVRNQCLWGTLLAGGAGVEWYFGYRYPDNDLGLENFRSRDNWWKQSAIATKFVSRFPLEEMHSADELVAESGAYCLANAGKLYLIYVHEGMGSTKLKLDNDSTFSVKWFNPRTGGVLKTGSVVSVQGKGFHELGNPPADTEKDWVVVVQ